jgi:hypothetical protein
MQGSIGVPLEYTWAAKPDAASVRANHVIFVTDIGNGSYFISDGTYWKMAHPVKLYTTGSTTTAVTNTTAETQVASFTLPGGVMGMNGILRLCPMFSQTNSANTKTLRIKLGAATAITQAFGGAGSASAYGILTVRNLNSQSSQKSTQGGSLGVGTTSSAIGTSAADTSADITVSLTVQMGALAETVTLEHLFVEVL